VTASRHPDLRPVTLVQTLDVLREGRRRADQKKKSEPNVDDPLGHLRRVQEEDGGGGGTCEAALAEAEEQLAAYEAQEGAPKYLFVQMADQCIFQITDNGNLILKSRHFHGDTVKFSDRPFTYEEEVATESFFDGFDDMFNADNGGKPNAAITLVQNDESKDVVVSVFVKAVVKHRDDPDGPTYVYKLEQSDEQASVEALSDVMGGKDKMTYDHCSIFIDDYFNYCNNCADGGCGFKCAWGTDCGVVGDDGYCCCPYKCDDASASDRLNCKIGYCGTDC
jgi:hypothetical protein